MSRPTRDGSAEPVSRDKILWRKRGQGNMYFPCSADRQGQDCQPYLVGPSLATVYVMAIHTYTYLYKCQVPGRTRREQVSAGMCN